MAQPEIIGHWSKLIDGFSYSPLDFYLNVENGVLEREIPKAELSRISFKEAGVFSASREYLRVSRYEHAFNICGAPFGRGFFVSWWLTRKAGCLASLPGFGLWLKPATFYSIDTGLMFQAAVDDVVQETLRGVMEAKGLRALSAEERKPVLKDFFRR